MSGRSFRAGAAARRVLVCALALGLLLAAAPAALASKAPARPVPSLTPAATQKLWRQLVRRPHAFSARAEAVCRPLRAVFYASTDWLRLATKLASNPSPCAQYFISIPPLAADKTAFRYDQPWRIRALGPQFHVLAEMNWTGWSGYVSSTGSTWYAAGQEARRRMAANGFDVSLGDTWIVNEASSAVRAGTGNARQNLRDFVRGLHDGNGTVPMVKGGVFISGIAQSTADLSTYKVNLQNWYQDAPFWQDMSADVDDWSQELYGDVRDYAAAGAPLTARRDSLNEYLQHEAALAGIAPASASAAAAFIRSAYSPLANAAWKWDTAYGWTSVPVAQMEDYVSAQTYALRSYGASSGLAQDHFGFAWSPKNLDGMPMADYDSQTNALLDRLAAAIHDSGVPSADPGSGACAPSWCSTVVTGAAFTGAWRTFATWSPPALGFASAPVSLAAGTAGTLTVQLQTAGIAQTDPSPVTVALASSSPHGLFAPGTGGPWTSTLSVTVPAGSTSASFAYEDITAGTPTLTASAAGRQTGSLAETITAGPLAALSLSPGSASVALGGTQAFTASGADAYGNPVSTSPSWSIAAGTPGTVAPASGKTTTFTGSSTATGSGRVIATAGSVTASAPVTVTGPTVRMASIAYAVQRQHLRITFSVVDAATGKPVTSASVSFSTLRGSAAFASGKVTTGKDGTATYTSAVTATKGCYSTAVSAVTAARYAWDGVTPGNQLCI